MWCENGLGVKLMNPLKPLQKQIFIKRRFCYQYGGISKVYCLTNSNQGTKRSIPISCRQLDNLNQLIVQKRPELVNR